MGNTEQRGPRRGSGLPRGLVLAILLFLAFAFLGSRGLWEPDEGRYVECAREMVLTGNWLVPTLGNVPHFTKPPLTYWAIASGLALLGMNEWGARVFLGLAFLATALLLSDWGERFWDHPAGRWAGIVYGSSLLPFAAASVVTTDTLLALCETAAVYAFWRGWNTPSPRREAAWNLGGWAATGLGFLVKGPPALLPLGGWAVFSLLCRQRAGLRNRLRWMLPGGPLLFTAIALPWFLGLVLAGKGILDYLVVDEVIRRVFTGIHHRNSEWYKAFVVYGPALLLGALPWCLAWPAMVRARLARRGTVDSRTVFLACWFAVPLVIFLVSRSRLPFYVLPLFAPLALATAGGLVPRPGAVAPRLQRLARTLVVLALVALPGLRAVAALAPLPRDDRALASWIRSHVPDPRTEIVLVDRPMWGLPFYLGLDTELVRDGHDAPVSFWPAERLAAELDELSTTTRPHLFVLERSRAPRFLRRLVEAGAACRNLGVRGRTSLVWCPSAPADPHPVGRVVVAAASGGDLVDAYSVARTLYELAERTPLAGIVLVHPGSEPGVPGELLDPVALLRPLVKRGIPSWITGKGVPPGRILLLGGKRAHDVVPLELPPRPARPSAARLAAAPMPEGARARGERGWRVLVRDGCPGAPAPDHGGGPGEVEVLLCTEPMGSSPAGPLLGVAVPGRAGDGTLRWFELAPGPLVLEADPVSVRVARLREDFALVPVIAPAYRTGAAHAAGSPAQWRQAREVSRRAVPSLPSPQLPWSPLGLAR